MGRERGLLRDRRSDDRLICHDEYVDDPNNYQWVMVKRKIRVFVFREFGELSVAARHIVWCIKEEEICRTRCMNRVEQLKWFWTNL